jgi:hypothetical protein
VYSCRRARRIAAVVKLYELVDIEYTSGHLG